MFWVLELDEGKSALHQDFFDGANLPEVLTKVVLIAAVGIPRDIDLVVGAILRRIGAFCRGAAVAVVAAASTSSLHLLVAVTRGTAAATSARHAFTVHRRPFARTS